MSILNLLEHKEVVGVSLTENKRDHGDREKYLFETVEMTDQEFKSLPDFNGF